MVVLSSIHYLLILVLFVGAVGTGLWYLKPSVTEATVLAFVPWIAGAASLSVQLEVTTVPMITPLPRSLHVYLLTFVFAGSVWIIASMSASSTWSVSTILSFSGLLFMALIVGTTLELTGISNLLWPTASVVITAVLTAAVWSGFETSSPRVTAETGTLGELVVFSQLLDGVTTITGVDLLGLVEQTPFSRTVLDFAAALPTAEMLGVGWVFALLKLVLALLVIHLVHSYFGDDPTRESLLLGIAAITGLGPGFHNLLLYVGGP